MKKNFIILILMLFALLSPLFQKVYASNSSGLSQEIVTYIQQKFGGRVIGIRKKLNNCREYIKEINIGGKNAQGYGTACAGEGEDWQTGDMYNVQVMIDDERIIIVTVNGSTGEIKEIAR